MGYQQDIDEVANTIFAAPFSKVAYKCPSPGVKEHAIVDRDGYTVASEVHGCAADLLAAAPSLYLALQAALAAMERMDPRFLSRLVDSEIAQARAALALANPALAPTNLNPSAQ